MEKLQVNDNLPPNYINLGFDADPTAGPSAPRINDEETSSEEYSEKIFEPPTPPPKYDDEPISFGPIPTAPAVDPRILQYNPPSLVFEEIYEACIRYVEAHCCYSSRFANRMKLTDINNSSAFYYSLESYGEKRESAFRYTPYKGQKRQGIFKHYENRAQYLGPEQVVGALSPFPYENLPKIEGGPIDGPANGRAPDPWEMYVPLMTAFLDSKTRMIIPHTDSLETCSRCSGTGKVTCSSCCGNGRSSCWRCNGRGRDSDGSNCSSCHGSGRRTCLSCSGTGMQTCSKCDGYGKIKSYKVLFVTWTNHLTDFVSDTGHLPAKKIKKASGDSIFFEEKEHLSPIGIAPDDSVNIASVRLLEAHQNSFTTEIIRRQRHALQAYPFTVARYKYKEDEGEFYIYGKEKEIYFENYPTDCCCCICC